MKVNQNKMTMWGYAVLCLLLFVACAKDEQPRSGQEPNIGIETNEYGERVLKLDLSDLEVDLDEKALDELENDLEANGGLRAMNYELNWGSKMGIKQPALEHGQEVKLSLIFSYKGNTGAPLIADEVTFVYDLPQGRKTGTFKMKKGSGVATVLLPNGVDSEGNQQYYESGSEAERQALEGKEWYYALVYKPSGSGFVSGGRLSVSPGVFKAYQRAKDEDGEDIASTHEYNGTPTQGKIDLGQIPFVSRWQKFDMAQLLNNSKTEDPNAKYKLPRASGLAPVGYFVMLSFQNKIPGNQEYEITKIKIRSQYVSYKGDIGFAAPTGPGANPVTYSSSYGDVGWQYTLGDNAERLTFGSSGRYYFFWGLFTQGQSPNFKPQIQVQVEGQAIQGEGKQTYTFPWQEMPSLTGATNKGRTLILTLKGRDPQASPTPGTGGTTPPPGGGDAALNPFDFFSSNYVRSEDNVRAGRVAEEVGDGERTRVQGVSSQAFYQSHSGNGSVLRTSTWTPKANAMPNGRRWPSLTDWTSFIPLSNSNRLLTSKADPAYSEDIYLQLGKWWGIQIPGHPNFTKKVRRTGNELDKQNVPQQKPAEHGRTVYEITGGKEIVSINTNNGSSYTLALGAEYIAHTDGGAKNTVFYGKRFMGKYDASELSKLRVEGRAVKSEELNDASNFPGTTPEAKIAQLFPDNSQLSAWRYEILKEGRKYQETLTIKVQYVYLGPSRANVTIDQIGTEEWWKSEAANVRHMELRTPRYHSAFIAVPHLTNSYYNNTGVAFFIDDTTVWYEEIENFNTNSSTNYYLKLAIDPTSSASGLGGN